MPVIVLEEMKELIIVLMTKRDPHLLCRHMPWGSYDVLGFSTVSTNLASEKRSRSFFLLQKTSLQFPLPPSPQGLTAEVCSPQHNAVSLLINWG